MVMLHYRWCNMIVCREERCTHAEARNGFPSCVTSPVSIARFDWCAAKQCGVKMPELQGTGGRYRENIWGGVAI